MLEHLNKILYYWLISLLHDCHLNKKTSDLYLTSLSLLKVERSKNLMLNKYKCLTKI